MDFEAGEHLKITEYAYFRDERTSVAALVLKSPEELSKLEEASVKKEEELYQKISALVSDWKKQAENTIDLRKAKEYLWTFPVNHTYNKWEKDNNWYVLSNMVYKMSYHISERTRRYSYKKPAVSVYDLDWDLVLNAPSNSDQAGYGRKIAGQKQKVFDDKASLEKYLNGRIKAYSHLFTEISPPIPKEYEKHFYVNGVLLPGYTVESPELLAPDNEAVEDLLSLLSEEDLGGAAPEAAAPQPEEKTPEAVWSRNRQKHQSASKPTKAPTR